MAPLELRLIVVALRLPILAALVVRRIEEELVVRTVQEDLVVLTVREDLVVRTVQKVVVVGIENNLDQTGSGKLDTPICTCSGPTQDSTSCSNRRGNQLRSGRQGFSRT